MSRRKQALPFKLQRKYTFPFYTCLLSNTSISLYPEEPSLLTLLCGCKAFPWPARILAPRPGFYSSVNVSVTDVPARIAPLGRLGKLFGAEMGARLASSFFFRDPVFASPALPARRGVWRSDRVIKYAARLQLDTPNSRAINHSLPLGEIGTGSSGGGRPELDIGTPGIWSRRKVQEQTTWPPDAPRCNLFGPRRPGNKDYCLPPPEMAQLKSLKECAIFAGLFSPVALFVRLPVWEEKVGAVPRPGSVNTIIVSFQTGTLQKFSHLSCEMSQPSLRCFGLYLHTCAEAPRL
ncbi:hypothetical protein Bbelb_030330 [Branchiostoma belcheri]|nr:hypothetical protein Bbelb_030330 [Branchiostoma belcheri]